MPPPAQGNQPDNSTAILWIVGAVFGILAVIWFVFRDKIISAYLSLKLYEVILLNKLTIFFHFHPYYFEGLQSQIQYHLMHVSAVTFQSVISIGNTVGVWIRLPITLLLFICAFIIYFGNTSRVYKRNYTMDLLAEAEKVNWPQITPVLGLDLLSVDIDQGPWAMAMTPLQFCKKYHLLDEFKPQYQGGRRADWDRMDIVLRRGKANQLFSLQLGPLWQGPNKLSKPAKALFAVFAARINAETAPALKILKQLAASSTGKLDYTGVDALLKKHYNTKLVQRIVQSHAYVLTVMASMLAGAREDGVQASADFLWLKAVDRRLWYMLNVVGRQTPFIEVAGPFAHWVAEKEFGAALFVPMVETATDAVELALKEVVYRRDEV